jgi:CDP-paratose 2-epimerase
VLEAITMSQRIAGRGLPWSYEERNRTGDHIWWIGDNGKFQTHYPEWTQAYDVERILAEIFEANRDRWKPGT